MRMSTPLHPAQCMQRDCALARRCMCVGACCHWHLLGSPLEHGLVTVLAPCTLRERSWQGLMGVLDIA